MKAVASLSEEQRAHITAHDKGDILVPVRVTDEVTLQACVWSRAAVSHGHVATMTSLLFFCSALNAVIHSIVRPVFAAFGGVK